MSGKLKYTMYMMLYELYIFDCKFDDKSLFG